MNLPMEAMGAGRNFIPASETGSSDPVAGLGVFLAVLVAPAVVAVGLWFATWVYDRCRRRGRTLAVPAAVVAALPGMALAWGLVTSSAVRQTVLEAFGILLALYLVVGVVCDLWERTMEVGSRWRASR